MNKVKNYPYCLGVLNGVVRNVYLIDKWQPGHRGREEGRYEFTGTEASDDIKKMFINKRILGKYRKKGMAKPVLYYDN